MTCRTLLYPACILLAIFAGPLSRANAEATDAELLAGADARIEKCRKADVAIRVVDSAGKPLPDVQVHIEQTRHAFLFGSNIFLWGKITDPKLETLYRDRFAALLNFATLPFYWPSYEPTRGNPIHARIEKVARWCKEQGIAVKGHPLAWNFADAAWYPTDADELYRLQMARIDDCVRHFVGLIDCWDVVNEATHFDRPEFLQKAPKHTGMWKKYGQIPFTRTCFEHARQANPKATLLINDYRTDPPYERVIEQLVDAGGKRQYDVIGIQSHMHGGTWTNRNIWSTCERFARFGVPLHFTETTILSGEQGWGERKGKKWPSTAEGEALQAREVVRFYTMLFSHPAIEAITWWDFSDHHSWQAAPAGFLRADMTPKPAYEELKRLIKDKWWTRADLKTSNSGEARLRGFLGDYTVTVRTAQGTVAKKVSLSKGDANRWEITVGDGK